ncbi:MAG TPA: response regulator transcription factor [Thermoanaerobaculia bacterium]|jgi:DNA-binding response OmpR family regulator|nr:response regulator transcription factor [Thermoanaerobaculia bacterium]
MARDLVLVVEDDLAVRRGLADALRWAGFEPLEAGDGDLGQQLALERPVRLVLLDLVLPRRQGLQVLQAIRAGRPGLPVILLTAMGGEEDRVRGLTLGADDYVVKPFSVRELLARVESVLRRSAERTQGPSCLTVPGGEVDLLREEVRWDDGSRQPLTGLEANLLRYLASSPGRLLTRDELLQRVWQIDSRRVRTRTLDMTIARLRKKLRDEQDPPRVVLTVRGRGYRLNS